MMDCFSPTFSRVFCRNIKQVQNRENFNFFLVGFTLFLSSRLFLSGIQTGAVCTSVLTGKHDWSISLVAKCKIKSCLATCVVSVTLPLSSRGARSVTSLTLYDVNK